MTIFTRKTDLRFFAKYLYFLLFCLVAWLNPNFAQAQAQNDKISVPSSSNILRCGPGSVTFAATGCSTGYTTKWYEDGSLANEVGSGITFTTQSLEKTTEYFLACASDADGKLKSVAVKVTAVVNPELAVTISGPDTLCASRLPYTYVGLPAGGKFILPNGLPAGFVTVSENLLTVNPGFDLANTAFSYQQAETTNACAVPGTADKYITIARPIKPTITKPVTVCAGTYVNLQVENCPGRVQWQTGSSYASNTVNPSVTTDYSARCFVGGCDTTLTTRVTIEGIKPMIDYAGSVCRDEKKIIDLTFRFTEGATLSTNIGNLQGNTVYGVPSGSPLVITAVLDGCKTEYSEIHNCEYVAPSCFPPKIDTLDFTAATCNGSVVNSDASITIDQVFSQRYSFAKTLAGLASYSGATSVSNRTIVISGLPNPDNQAGQVYFIRLFNESGTCFLDTTVVLPFRDCRVPCVYPDAGNDVFVGGYQSYVKLPKAGINQKWMVAPENPSGVINASNGSVHEISQDGKYSFILLDGGTGGPCADTIVIYKGSQELPAIVTYSDTLTIPKYIVNLWTFYGVRNFDGAWFADTGNPATLTYSGEVSGLMNPGRYLFKMKVPYSQYTYGAPQGDTLTLTVIKLAKPDDCPPQRCIPFSIRRTKLAAK